MSELRDEAYIFRNAISRESIAERNEYLSQACGGDVVLRERIERLLSADALEDGFLETPVTREDLSVDSAFLTSPDHIGDFEVLRPIGHGAMAEVFLVRTKGRYQRTAACKLLREDLIGTKMHSQMLREGEFLARLGHPSIPAFYESGLIDAHRPYILMERVSGIPITEYCRDFELSLLEKIELFIKVCRGVEHAHTKGVIHRDLKPKNILTVDIDGSPCPKIIDFGISKSTIATTTSVDDTKLHEMTGSLAYMSPEHLRKNQHGIDTRSDIYSLGVLFYEMLVGDHPYYEQLCDAQGLEEIIEIIRERVPPRPSLRYQDLARGGSWSQWEMTRVKNTSGFSRDLDVIVEKMMAKDIDERYGTVSQVVDDFRNYLECRPLARCRNPIQTGIKRWLQRNRNTVLFVLAVCSCCILMGGYWSYTRNYLQKREDQYTEQIEEIRSTLTKSREAMLLREAARREGVLAVQQAVEERNPSLAFMKANQIKDTLFRDPFFQQIWESVSAAISCSDLPSDTIFELQVSEDGNTRWEFLGKTPFVHLPVPKGRVQLRLSHPEYVTREINLKLPEEFDIVQPRLFEAKKSEERGMVLIPSSIFLEGPIDMELEVNSDFWIDQQEVTNHQFKKFIDEGGYLNESHWEGMDLHRKGQRISLLQAREFFVDSTGKLGPATWENGTYESGKADYPVDGISWFEARAYANHVGKKLPTQAHWKKASSSSYPMVLARMSNFGTSLRPVTEAESIGYYNAHDLFGNVREWCENDCEDGRRALLGAAAGDADYLFYMPRVCDPWERDAGNGFRCIKLMNEKEYVALSKISIDLPNKKLVSIDREPFGDLQHWYRYDKEIPLDPRFVSSEEFVSESAEGYKHEVVEVTASYEDSRFKIHLFEPKENKDAVTLLYIPGIGRYNSPGSFAISGKRDMDIDFSHRLAMLGHRVVYPIYNGTYERWNGVKPSSHFSQNPTVAQTKWVHGIKDVFRTLDYLVTREDINQERLICVGLSNGAARGVTAMSIDSRFAAGVLISAGFSNWHSRRPVINEYHFAPHVHQPVLMITGLQDSLYRYENSQVPLFQDLGSTEKKHVVLPGGHLPEVGKIVEETHQWIADRYPSTRD